MARRGRRRCTRYVATGVPVVGLEPSCLAALRSDAAELLDDPRRRPRSPPACAPSPSCSPSAAAGRRPTSTGIEVVAQPHCHHASVLGFDADLAAARARRARRSPGSAAAAGWPATSAWSRATTRPSVAVAEHPPAPGGARGRPGRGGAGRRDVLPGPAGRPGRRRALHLAELLAGRAALSPDRGPAQWRARQTRCVEEHGRDRSPPSRRSGRRRPDRSVRQGPRPDPRRSPPRSAS